MHLLVHCQSASACALATFRLPRHHCHHLTPLEQLPLPPPLPKGGLVAAWRVVGVGVHRRRQHRCGVPAAVGGSQVAAASKAVVRCT